jgi:hypothetical protein
MLRRSSVRSDLQKLPSKNPISTALQFHPDFQRIIHPYVVQKLRFGVRPGSMAVAYRTIYR